MSKTKRFVRIPKKQIKYSSVLSKTNYIDSVSKTKIKMIAKHSYRSR